MNPEHVNSPLFFNPIQKLAPRLLGALLLSLASLTSVSCDREKNDLTWNPPTSQKLAVTESASPSVVAEASIANNLAKPDAPSTEPLRFMAYNVKNWLTMDRYVNGKNLKGASKPDDEKAAVIALISRHTPDIIGICEIGEASDLAEIQEKLKSAGLDLPHLHYTGGSDAVRRLGLLSRYPITSTAKPADVNYTLSGKSYAINRGILDATVTARGKSYRFLGVHLKSKRETEVGDQAAMRLNEARLLRRHIDHIFTTNTDARLIVYGDFNDTRPTPTIKAITGKYNAPTYLTAIPAKDSAQTAWTHHWAFHDLYSRIDFVMVSRALKPEVDFPAAKIIDDEEWNQASDHRAILTNFR